jgi:hypothetical protein
MSAHETLVVFWEGIKPFKKCSPLVHQYSIPTTSVGLYNIPNFSVREINFGNRLLEKLVVIENNVTF